MIDFLFNDTLLEVKYHRDLESKQLAFFENFSAKRKIVIKSYADFQRLG